VIRRVVIGAACLLSMQAVASAQSWPARPIRAIIPFGAGSATDLVPRIVFEQLSSQLGQPIVVENRTAESSCASGRCDRLAAMSADGTKRTSRHVR
jgi:tripartite-type tricarboxylate transporter receptor subunit TctC